MMVGLRKIDDREYRVPDPLNCPFRFVHIGRGIKETGCLLDPKVEIACPDYEKFPEYCLLGEGIKLVK